MGGCFCTKWSKDALNGQYFQKFTQLQERNWRLLGTTENSLIFHSHNCRFHSCRFFGCLSKTSSKLDKIGNSRTKCDENHEKWGGYLFSGSQTHLIHDTKWGGGGGSSQIFQNLS